MKTTSTIALLFITLCIAQTSFTTPEEFYLQNKQFLRVDERLALANQIVLSATDPAILDGVLDEYLMYAWKEEKINPALQAIDARLSGSLPVPNMKMALTEARLLSRVGRYEEADAIFQEGMENQWEQASEHYYKSLSERSEFVALAAQVYRNAFNPKCGTKKDFAYFAETLWKYKRNNPSAVAQDSVLPLLQDLPDYPQAKEIAQALCRLMDWQFEPAIQQLQSAKKALEEQKAGGAALSVSDAFYEEDRHIDLYLCFAYLLEGRDYPAARTALQEFYNKNTDDYNYIYDKALWMVHQFELGENTQSKVLEITSFLIQSDIVNNEEVKAQFTDEKLAHLWDMHHYGLHNSGRYNEALSVRKFVVDTYFPQTRPGAYCAQFWANHLAGQSRLDEAEALFERIVTETDFKDLTPWVKLSWADVKKTRKQYSNALNLLNEVIQATEGAEEPRFKECYRRAKAQEREIMELAARGR